MLLSGTTLWTRSNGWNAAARPHYHVAVGGINSKVFRMGTPIYQPFPDTHWSLVRRAGFSDGAARREALATLLARYHPALMSYLTRVWQLSEDSAQELLQGFIADQILERQLLKHAEEGQGRFRALLVSCLRNFAVSDYRAQRVRKTTSLPVDWQDATEETPSHILDALWARELIGN